MYMLRQLDSIQEYREVCLQWTLGSTESGLVSGIVSERVLDGLYVEIELKLAKNVDGSCRGLYLRR